MCMCICKHIHNTHIFVYVYRRVYNIANIELDIIMDIDNIEVDINIDQDIRIDMVWMWPAPRTSSVLPAQRVRIVKSKSSRAFALLRPGCQASAATNIPGLLLDRRCGHLASRFHRFIHAARHEK